MQETSSQEETQIEIVKSVNSFFIHFSKASKEIYHEELFTEKGNVSRHRSMFQLKLTIYIGFVCNFSYIYIIFIYLKYLYNCPQIFRYRKLQFRVMVQLLFFDESV